MESLTANTIAVDWGDPRSVRAHIDGFAAMIDPHIDAMLARASATPSWETMGGLDIAVGTPHQMRHPNRAILKVHGGSVILMGGRFAQAEATVFAGTFGCKVYSVDYRMPPADPFPAALDDCVASYRELLKRYSPERIVVFGNSTGAALAGAAMLNARDRGLPLPAAAVFFRRTWTLASPATRGKQPMASTAYSRPISELVGPTFTSKAMI
jgi:acetyl esterase/lipase